jgi:hypothetical protein
LSYQWTMLKIKALMFHLQCILLSETRCDKKGWGSRKLTFFSSWTFFSALSHTAELYVQHTKPKQSSRECCLHISCDFSILTFLF